MPVAYRLLLTLAALVGHFSIAVWLFNRLHALALSRPTIKRLERLLLLVAAVVALAVLVLPPFGVPRLALPYAVICWAAAAAVLPMWALPKTALPLSPALQSNDTVLIDIAARLGFQPLHGSRAKFLGRVPGNQLLHLAVQKKTLRLPRLPKELDGLKIAHLSDLHMTGQLGREFYDFVVDETNKLSPDLVVITGDILEQEHCLPWIGSTLGRLEAANGKYFLFGNHETRLPNVELLRQALEHAGQTDVGGRCEHADPRGVRVEITGTALPWFGPPPPIPKPSVPGSVAPFRILLSHSPDQLPWARRHDFDLMLAGHTHGGQIRLPVFGALISPSRFGFRYAGGVFDEPPTLMHVSRGLAGIHPIRLNCPPELALLILKSE